MYMLTIRDLIGYVEVQGGVQIKRICGDDIDVVYETEDGLYNTKELTPYLDKEILYMYVNSIPMLCIEYRENEDN